MCQRLPWARHTKIRFFLSFLIQQVSSSADSVSCLFYRFIPLYFDLLFSILFLTATATDCIKYHATMLYIRDVWPFLIIFVVLLVFALSNQVSEASKYINEGKFCKRPSGPSTTVTRDLLGFCNIRNNSLSPAFRLPCWQALLRGVSAGELPLRLERGYVRIKWSLSKCKSLSESKMLCSRTQHNEPGLGPILKSSDHEQGFKSYFEIEI